MLRIRELRRHAGLTMKELGAVIGVAESTVSQYETGKRQPDYETLLRLGEFFGVSVDYILGGSTTDEYSARFREGLSRALDTLRGNLAGDEPGMADFMEMQSLIENPRPLTLAEACNAADVVGTTVGNLLGETIESQDLGKKKSPGPDESEPRDELDREVIALFHSLRPAQRGLALSILKTVVAESQGKPVEDQATAGEPALKAERQ